jgi:hypothetical protein
VTRCHLEGTVRDDYGNVVEGVSVEVRQPGTETPITDALYAATTGDDELANPLTTDEYGCYSAWLDTPQIVDLYLSGAGITPRTEAGVQVGGSGGGDAADSAFAPTTEGDWTDPPSTTATALDELASNLHDVLHRLALLETGRLNLLYDVGGLTLGIKPHLFRGETAAMNQAPLLQDYPGGTIDLDDDETTYVYICEGGGVQANEHEHFPASGGDVPLGVVQTAGGVITSIQEVTTLFCGLWNGVV